MENGKMRMSTFTCYFCNKTIENETESGHISVCSQVLVPCPYKCGSYVPRKSLIKHKSECLNRTTKATIPRPAQQVPVNNSLKLYNSDSLDRSLKTQTQLFQDQIGKLSKRLSECEKQYSEKLHSRSQNGNFSEAVDKLSKSQVQHSLEIETIKYQILILTEWKKYVDQEIQNLGMTLGSLQSGSKESQFHWTHLQEKLMVFEKFQMDLNFLRDLFYNEQNSSKKFDLEIAQNLDALRDSFTQENAATGALWNDHSLALESLKKEVKDINASIDEQKAKFTNYVFDLRAVSQIASEAAEKVEIQEREFMKFRKEVNQIKMDLEILEELSASDSSGVCGSIIWKIREVENKMKRSKENDIVLKSPVFYSHHYGYKIKVLLYLNGLKKWKDRYALLCLQVLKGDYDMLLKWPCHIEGTIILKDLENLDNPRDFSKFITAKRKCGNEETEDPQESSSTYIFIPHTVLIKEKHVQNDTIILEIKIKNPVSKLETNL